MFLVQSFLYSDCLAFFSGLNHRMVLLLLFSHSIMSDALQPHRVQHTRLPCPSLSPEVCSDLCPLSRWCHPAISSSVALFSSCPQSFPASGSFPKSQLRIRWPKYWSFSFSISPSNEYSGLICFKIDCFEWSGCSKMNSKSPTTTRSSKEWSALVVG